MTTRQLLANLTQNFTKPLYGIKLRGNNGKMYMLTSRAVEHHDKPRMMVKGYVYNTDGSRERFSMRMDNFYRIQTTVK